MAERSPKTHRSARRVPIALLVLLTASLAVSAGEGGGQPEAREAGAVTGASRPAVSPGAMQDPRALTLNTIQGWTASDRKAGQGELGQLRRALLQETAQQVAATAALATETRIINQVFEKYGEPLDQVYRFDQLTLHDGMVLPAVIKEANDRAAMEAGTLRRVLRAYRIAQAEQLLTRAPRWRQWLIEEYAYPEKPLDQLLPRDGAESAVWRQAAAEGWEYGIAQAHEVARIRLAKLQQSFVGMIRYHLLKACRMVTEPDLKKTRRGVTASGPELLIGEVLYTIARTTRFRPGDWDVYPEIPTLFDTMTGLEPAVDGVQPPPPLE